MRRRIHMRRLLSFVKALLCTLVVCSVVAGTGSKLRAAEPVLSIGTVRATEGQTVKTRVQYTANGAEVSAFQFDLHYDHNAIAGISASIGSAGSAAGKTLTSAVLKNGNIRYLVFGFNQTVIGNGDVIDLTITMASEVEPGPYSLQMLNPAASDPNGNSVPIVVESGKIVVPSPDK
jgi:hypothetical protein